MAHRHKFLNSMTGLPPSSPLTKHRSALHAAGACAIGFAPIGEMPDEEMERYRRWLADGHQAGMEYMANHEAIRRNPRLLLEGAQTIISLAFPYPDGSERPKSLPAIASYAQGSDYHDVLRTRLKGLTERLKADLGGEYRICIDSAPIFERFWAEKCGIGQRADNGLIAVPGYGTRVFLAEIITTLNISEITEISTLPIPSRDSGDSCKEDSTMDCIHCGACRRACPAGALQPDSTVDAGRCLSYLTIEHRGEWDAIGEKAMSTPAGRHTLFGCDLCQRVCPINRMLKRGTGKHTEGATEPLPELLPRPEIVALTSEEIIRMNQTEFSSLFKGSPIKRAKLAGLRRNALNTQGPDEKESQSFPI